jgi:UDP-glucose 4-epimerase
MKRVVVFGGAGFIGNKLCALLSAQGHTVICLGRDRIDFYDPQSWIKYIEDGDYVVNLVTLHLSKKSQGITEEIYFKALEALAQVCLDKKIKNLLYLSSGGSVYGRSNKPFTETDIPNPVSPYGILKLKSEQLLISYQEKFGLPLSIARPSNIYGETDKVGVISNFFTKISTGINLEIYGDLEISKDYLHVDDLVQGLNLILTQNKTGIYNFGYGENHTLQEIIQIIEKLLNKKSTQAFYPLSATDIHTYALDCTKARDELGFKPTIDLEAGIKRYLTKGLI